MPKILLINPNSSVITTDMMVAIATNHAEGETTIHGATAASGPSMIVTEDELRASAIEVLKAWRSAGDGWDGVIVGAFGDPGIARMRMATHVPVVGIAEASMLEAGSGGRRFGVATTTPALVPAIDARAFELGLRAVYTGVRLTQGDPNALVANARALEDALGSVVQRCIREDGAEAVIIGGGPLGQAAIGLSGRFSVPVIAPISAAMRLLRVRMSGADAAPPA